MIYLLNWRVWVVIATVAALSGTHYKAYKSGAAGVQAAWDAQTVLRLAQKIQQQQETRDKETQLQADKEQLRKAKNVQIAKLDSDLADALGRLRNRPDRPGQGDMPTVAGTGPSPGCTGDQLFRQDAEFLIREAGRADRLLAYLGQCEAQYDKAREALK
jgi:hypothetical protein